MFKNFDVKSWVIFSETYGQPIRVGKYGLGTSADDRKILQTALRNIAQDCAAMIPESMALEFIEAKMTGNIDLFERTANWFDQQISKAVLGQVGTTDAIAGGHAVGRVHRQVEEDIERADAKALEATLNRDLVRAIVDLNFGPRSRYPALRIVLEDAQDLVQIVNAVSSLVDRGMLVTMTDMRQRLGLKEPKPGEAMLTPAKSGGALAATPQTDIATHAKNIAPQTDAIDTLTDELLSDWEPLMAPLLDPVQKLLGECHSLDEFRRRLLAWYRAAVG